MVHGDAGVSNESLENLSDSLREAQDNNDSTKEKTINNGLTQQQQQALEQLSALARGERQVPNAPASNPAALMQVTVHFVCLPAQNTYR